MLKTNILTTSVFLGISCELYYINYTDSTTENFDYLKSYNVTTDKVLEAETQEKLIFAVPEEGLEKEPLGASMYFAAYIPEIDRVLFFTFEGTLPYIEGETSLIK